MMKLKIKKGDTVQVIAGKSKGTSGRVLDINADKMQVLVEGANVRIKHEKPSQRNQQGGRIEKEMPIHYSNVMLVDEKGKPTRIGIKVTEENGKTTKERVAKTTGKTI